MSTPTAQTLPGHFSANAKEAFLVTDQFVKTSMNASTQRLVTSKLAAQTLLAPTYVHATPDFQEMASFVQVILVQKDDS